MNLEIHFGVDSNADGVEEISITPFSLPLKDGAMAEAAKTLVAVADAMDAQPLDGEAEYSTKMKLPVLKIFGRQLSFSVPISVSLKIVEA